MHELLRSRNPSPISPSTCKRENEGGCGVLGLASTQKIGGVHLLPALCQMKNRGNGKGGGIAAAGLLAEDFGVTQEILENDYLLAIAYLDKTARRQVEEESILSLFEIDHVHTMPSTGGVPEAILYFVRVKQHAIDTFRTQHALPHLDQKSLEDELVYQNTYTLNRKFYATTGTQKAFVLSHAKNLLVLKCVGYADDVIRSYHLEELKAHIWIGHHRYPTKGKVWHPGGAHPFIGMHEALVHNGDFANYSAMCEYLAQRNIHPLFLTDTEIGVLLFDLFSRTYRYPLEYIMEAFAPTTERDFYYLPKEKQHIYDLIQKTHLHASPDGPWFFLIAQSQMNQFRLIGITDTSMLRPQVFALQAGKAPIGIIASEKQAIDALLESLADKEEDFWPRADYYWSCRGGSHTDGGAFSFTVERQSNGNYGLICTDKFGKPFAATPPTPPGVWKKKNLSPSIQFPDLSARELSLWAREKLREWTSDEAIGFLNALKSGGTTESHVERVFHTLTYLLDHIYPMRHIRRSFWFALVERTLQELITELDGKENRERIILDARGYLPEGENSLARALVQRYKEGYKKFIVANCRGHRFIGNGLGPGSHDVEIDVYGSSGDYLGSGIDGAQIRVHGNIQDQAAQIMKEGKLVVFGGVGQALLYGAKGGTTFVRGSTGGRPLINAVGKAKLIINGTALDYCAESFMAGDPLYGGGFAVINRIAFNNEGELYDLHPPYPGSTLFSLASGGAIYIRDPNRDLTADQLNGGIFAPLSQADEDLIIPYLEENALLFEIPVSRLLQNNNHHLSFQEAYRKIIPARTHHLDPEEAWITNSKKPHL